MKEKYTSFLQRQLYQQMLSKMNIVENYQIDQRFSYEVTHRLRVSAQYLQ